MEGQGSAWGVVEALRADGEAREIVSSVDDVDTAAGRISLPLVLERGADEPTGHYGDGPGADDPVPQPSPEG